MDQATSDDSGASFSNRPVLEKKKKKSVFNVQNG